MISFHLCSSRKTCCFTFLQGILHLLKCAGSSLESYLNGLSYKTVCRKRLCEFKLLDTRVAGVSHSVLREGDVVLQRE